MDSVCFTGGELTVVSTLLAALVGTITFLFRTLWTQREAAKTALVAQYEARLAALVTERDGDHRAMLASLRAIAKQVGAAPAGGENGEEGGEAP